MAAHSQKELQQLAARTTLAMQHPWYFMRWPLGYMAYPHQKIWLDNLMNHDRVLILAPPDHGKTVTCAISYLTWKITLNRNLRCLILSYSEDQAEKDIREIRFHLEGNHNLIDNFPPTFMPENPERWTDSELIVQRERIPGKMKDSTLMAKGAFSGIQNRRFDLIVVDDIVDPQTTATPKTRKDLHDWYFEQIEGRVERDGQVAIIGSRQHTLDLYSDVMVNPEYRCYTYKAFEPVSKKVLAPEMWAKPDYKTKEEMITSATERLERKRRMMTPRAFEKKFNQSPYSDENCAFSEIHLNLCKHPMLTFCQTHKDINESEWKITLGVDLAISKKRGSSYFIIIVLAYNIKTSQRRLLNYYRSQGVGYPDQKRRIKEYCGRYLPLKCVVESNAYQEAILQDEHMKGLPLIGTVTGDNKYDLSDGIPHLVDLTDSGTEEERRTPIMELPYGDEESRAAVDTLVAELLSYPNGFTDLLMGWSFAERGILEYLVQPVNSEPGIIRPTFGQRRVPRMYGRNIPRVPRRGLSAGRM